MIALKLILNLLIVVACLYVAPDRMGAALAALILFRYELGPSMDDQGDGKDDEPD